MRVSLGEFGSAAIGDDAEDLSQAVETALTSYVGQLESGRAAVRLPRFRRRSPATQPAVDVELHVDPEVLVALERESQRQRVTLDRLTEHAVLVYVADCAACDQSRSL